MVSEQTPQATAYEEYFGGISKLISFRRDNYLDTYGQSMPIPVEPQIKEFGVSNPIGYEAVPRARFCAAVDAALHGGAMPDGRAAGFPPVDSDDENVAYFLAKDAQSGFTVDYVGLISHMFNVGERRGLSWNMLIEAVRHGGCYLFCPNSYHLINGMVDVGFIAVAKCDGHERAENAWADGHVGMCLLRSNCQRATYGHEEHEDMPIPAMSVEDADEFMINLMQMVGA